MAAKPTPAADFSPPGRLIDLPREVLLRLILRAIPIITGSVLLLAAGRTILTGASFVDNPLIFIPLLLTPAFLLILLVEKRLSYRLKASILLLSGTSVVIFDYATYGLVGNSLLTLVFLVVLSLVLLDLRSSSITLILAVVLHLTMAVLIRQGILQPQLSDSTVLGNGWLINMLRFGITLIMLTLLVFYHIDRARNLLARQQTLVAELGERRRQQQERIEQRTRGLALTTEIARSLSNILDWDQLVQNIVDQIQSAYGYYHVQIYLVDSATGELRLEAGTANRGRALRSMGHSLPAAQGIVGRCAARKEALLVTHVHQSDIWLPNPLLPETEAELAVPIITERGLLGVLDIQDNRPDRLADGDLTLLELVALQIGPTIENAQKFAEVSRAAAFSRAVNRVDGRLRPASDLHTVLRIAAEEISGRLPQSDVTITLEPAAIGRPADEVS